MKSIKQNIKVRPLLVTGTLLASCFAIGALPGLASANSTASPSAMTHTVKHNGEAGVDGLIAHLHEELKITSDQEPQFQKLADVMRENAETMRTMAQKRTDAAPTRTAVDDLKSYAEISQAHAEGAQKMVPVFQSLYNSMSEDQKKIADVEFREHYTTHHHHHKS